MNNPDPNNAVDVLSKVGGFDLAAVAGGFIGASEKRIPAVIDGFISVVAALCAVRICPGVRDYLVPSHASYEIGYRIAMKELGLEPLFNLGMRLGEGSDYIYSDAARYDEFTENYRRSLASVDAALAEVSDTVIELCAGNVVYHKRPNSPDFTLADSTADTARGCLPC